MGGQCNSQRTIRPCTSCELTKPTLYKMPEAMRPVIDAHVIEALRPLLHRADVLQMLSSAVYNPTAERLKHICRAYS